MPRHTKTCPGCGNRFETYEFARVCCSIRCSRIHRGPPPQRTPDEVQRFVAARVAVTGSGCWEWTRSKRQGGYGYLKLGGRKVPAHRASYEAFVGPIGPGLQIDHLCRNRLCCNPAHLEPVSARVNTLRSEGVAAKNAAKTCCVNGHALSGRNLILRPSENGRRCRICRLAEAQRYRERRRAASGAEARS